MGGFLGGMAPALELDTTPGMHFAITLSCCYAGKLLERLEFQRMGCQNTRFRDHTRVFVRFLALPHRAVALYALLCF